MENKVKLTYYDLEDNISVESVWVKKEGNNYRVKNAPFFAPNLAYDDLISVEEDNGELYFDKIVKTSEHSTIQVVFLDKSFLEEVTNRIEDMNCNWEGSHLETYISLDVPNNINYRDIKVFLTDLRKEKILDYKESCLSDTHRQQL